MTGEHAVGIRTA